MPGERGVVRRDAQGGAVRFERRYEATVDELWAALTDPAQLAVWITPDLTFEARVGGRVEFRWSDESRVAGAVMTCDPPNVLEYTWEEGKARSVVRFELRAAGDATVLVLDHRGLPLDEATGFGAGWQSHLDWLVLHLRGEAAGFDQQARYQELAPT